ncbi:nucleotidyltransferase [Acidithiobacillus sp. ATCC 19703]|uniref:Nucleotidyltransferase n=2 Tax=Acidithiobacillus concretivorus TaxID=3063952 RepID=A0ABS5ZPL8_9PROT|nr:nucleotidyltransferase [Acidithiobacillus concretivorus]
MKPSVALASNPATIRQIVESHHAKNAWVFGSVLNGQDTESSDLDILIDPTPETTLMDLATIQVDLEIVWKTIQSDLPELHTTHRNE